jgi:hypothetical protein
MLSRFIGLTSAICLRTRLDIRTRCLKKLDQEVAVAACVKVDFVVRYRILPSPSGFDRNDEQGQYSPARAKDAIEVLD